MLKHQHIGWIFYRSASPLTNDLPIGLPFQFLWIELATSKESKFTSIVWTPSFLHTWDLRHSPKLSYVHPTHPNTFGQKKGIIYCFVNVRNVRPTINDLKYSVVNMNRKFERKKKTIGTITLKIQSDTYFRIILYIETTIILNHNNE